jgi:hypothetical protein
VPRNTHCTILSATNEKTACQGREHEKKVIIPINMNFRKWENAIQIYTEVYVKKRL